jgi:acetolactate decarboxylase
MKRIFFLFSILFFILSNTLYAQNKKLNNIKIVGKMKNVMMKGELFGNIYLDTISNKKHLYGIGPLENLSGEILVIDGKAYNSTVLNEFKMKVERTFNLKAPFFVYGNQFEWEKIELPSNIKTLNQLEKFIDEITNDINFPFVFKIKGKIEYANIHIVNLASGSIVKSPKDAHKGQINYKIHNKNSEIIGFFSRKHKAIFTHHTTFMHLHLITNNRKMMGHLDDIKINTNMIQLYLPKFQH